MDTLGVNTTKVNEIPRHDTPIVRFVSISAKPVSYAEQWVCSHLSKLKPVLENGQWIIRNRPLILKKWTMNTSLFKEELTRIPVWVKLHDVPLQVFSEDGISLITSQIGKPMMLDSFTSSMCKLLGTRCLIEVKADEVLKDTITMGIPVPLRVRVILRKRFECSMSGNRPIMSNARSLVMCMTNAPRMQRLFLKLI
ncbi:zinc knuckle CX2CX4HX4C containing protein [Tanacetum coccineum]